MLVLFLSSYFMPTAPPSSVPRPPSAAGTKPSPASPEISRPSASAAGVEKAGSLQKPSPAAALQEITIETDDYVAVFSNEGAVLTGFQLKKYPNRQTHKPIQLVNSDPARVKPFSLNYSPVPDLNHLLFEVTGPSLKLTKARSQGRVVFRARAANGIEVEKSFDFKNGSYLIGLEVAVGQTGRQEVPSAPLMVEWADTLGQVEITGTSSRVEGHRVATLVNGRVSSESTKKSRESVEIPAPITWTSLADQFFVAALIPDPSSGGASARVSRDFNVYKTPTDENPNPGVDPQVFGPRPILSFAAPSLRAGEVFHRRVQAFVGPQDYSLLRSLNLQLENVVDFGTFGFISVYMQEILKWFFTWCHNWGLAILLLSVLVKLVLWFPTHSSYKNMNLTQQKMKELQPKLEAVKRKYADDKQEQQKQTMALYQQAGINPMGGCLPMLLQIPVFIALYSTLSHSIELRGASFLWLKDLTLKDPFYVLPLLMGVSMIVQQRASGQMTTQAAGQQKVMMWMMPVVLTFFSFQWPSGLLIYWVVTNLLSIIQQKVVNREIRKDKKKEGV